MKVAEADGGVDVHAGIAAIDWIVSHRTDNDMNVRVINLSFAPIPASPTQPTRSPGLYNNHIGSRSSTGRRVGASSLG